MRRSREEAGLIKTGCTKRGARRRGECGALEDAVGAGTKRTVRPEVQQRERTGPR